MSNEAPYRSRRNVVVGVMLVVLLLVFCFFVVGPYLVFHKWSRQIDEATEALKDPSIYEPSGRAMAEQCMNAHDHSPDANGGMEFGWAPQVLRDREPHWADFEKSLGHVEFGGGFHHFGYLVERIETASTAESSRWRLSIVADEAEDIILFEFEMENKPSVD